MKKQVLALIASFALLLCAAAYDKNTTGMIAAGKAAAPPVIDGNLDDRCWAESIAITPFTLLRQNRFAGEQTVAYITYDRENLYLAFQCRESSLEPAANRIHEFKREETSKDHDAIWSSDDCVAVLLAPDIHNPGDAYEFFINGAGTVSDARCRGGNLWESRDKTWESGIKASAQTGDGVWTVEAAIPLKNLNLTPDSLRTSGIVLGRIERSRKENSSWQPTADGFHSPAAFAALKFVDATPGIANVIIPAFNPGLNSLKLDFRPTKRCNRLQITQSLQFDGKKSAPVWKKFQSSAPVSLAMDVNLTETGNMTWHWTYTDASSMAPLFRSPLYKIAPTTAFLESALKGGKSDIFVNGRALVNGQAPLVKGSNVIAVRYSGDLSGGFRSNGLELPLEGRWKYSAAESKGWHETTFNDASWSAVTPENGIFKGQGFLRKTILCNESVIWPNWEKEGITMTANGLQPLICLPRGVKQHELDDYTFHLEVPADFSVQGASSFYNKHNIQFSGPESVVRNNRKLNRYSAMFNQRLPFRDTLALYEQFVFLVKAPASPRYPDNELYFHASSPTAGISEVPQKLKINLLPELDGVPPKKMIIQMWPGWFHCLSDSALRKELASEMAKMGVTESMIPSAKLPVFTQINFERWKLDCSPYLQQHPDHARQDSHGKSYPETQAYLCPERMLHDPGAQTFLSETIAAWFRKKGAIQHADWDYEHNVYDSYLACYCPQCLATFQKQYATTTELTPAVIKARYAREWTAFMNARMAAIAGMLNSNIKKIAPQVKFSVYSGYQSEFTKTGYGVDWAMLRGKIDIAMCGYGRPAREIENTLQAIGPETPLVTGLIVEPYNVEKRDFPTFCSEANIMQTLCDGTGGVLIFDMNSLDGRTFSALANVTKMVAANEIFFTTMNKVKHLPTVPGMQNDHLIMLKADDRRLLILTNPSAAPKRFKLESSAFPACSQFTDLATGRQSSTVSDVLESGKIKGFLLL